MNNKGDGIEERVADGFWNQQEFCRLKCARRRLLYCFPAYAWLFACEQREFAIGNWLCVGGLVEWVADGIWRQQECCCLKCARDGNCMPFGDSFKPMLTWEMRGLASGNRIIRDLPVSCRPHVVAYSDSWLPYLTLTISDEYLTIPIKSGVPTADRC